jgi:hypothetical protein
MGVLAAGINSSVTMYFMIAWFSQWFMRKRHPNWFAKYNYILGAGTSSLIGAARHGTEIISRSTGWRNPGYGVHLVLRGVGRRGEVAPVPELVGCKPEWKL